MTTSPVPHMTNDEWKELVDMWSDSKHKDKCIKNQLNREKVQFQQRTGSHSYIAQAHVVKQEKYKDVEPTAIDLFKDFHCSRKTGFSEPVKKAIAALEAIVDEVVEGQPPKLATEVVAQVVPKSTFLKNVGMVSSSMKNHSSQVQELQAELQTERQEKSELRQEILELKMQVRESETARSKQGDEIESLKKSSIETNSLIRQLLQFNQGQVGPSV